MHDFLDMLFGDIESGHFLIFGLPSKQTGHFRSVDSSIKLIKKLDAAGDNVYVGCGIYPQATKTRQKDKDVSGITAFWVDIDIAGPAHKASGLPEDRETALKVLSTAGVPDPSIAINSGHGLHLWWCFNEPLMFLGPDHRGETRQALEGFQATLRTLFGGVLDSTHDLSRILRVPDTTNRKKNCPAVPVTMVSLNAERRYELSDFDDFIADPIEMVAGKPATPVLSKEVEAWPVQVEAGREPPLEKIAALQTSDDRFAMTWMRKRADFKDQSQSSYDMSLATILLMGGWVNQEVVDTLIHHRKLGDEPEKLRKDYYFRTLKKARRDSDEEKAAVYVDDYEAGVDDNRRAQTFEALYVALGVRITRVVKYLSDPDPTYELEIDGQSIPLGKIDGITNQGQFKNKVAALSNQMIKSIDSKKGWPKIAQMLMDVRNEIEIGPEATEMGVFGEQLRSYLAEKQPASSINDESVIQLKHPYLDDTGATCVFGADLCAFVLRTYKERVTRQALGRLLRKAGFEPTVVGVVVDGENTTRSVWRGRV